MKNLNFKNIKEFSDIIHLTSECLCNILRYKKYKTFYIKKKNKTGYREICAPNFKLRLIQKWILVNVLEKYSVSKHATAFVKDCNGLLKNAEIHKNQKFILKLDLKDFYPSIYIDMIKKVFKDLGFSDFESRVFANLCTYNKTLPQGAITSPYLSNLVFLKLDNKIELLAKSKNMYYTRYADDLIFSGDDINDIFVLKREILKLINRHSRFKINKEKTKVVFPSMHKKITGITINNGEIKASKNIKQIVRMTLYNLFKNGKFPDKYNKNKIIGYISFVHLIEDSEDDFGYINKIINYVTTLMLKNNIKSDFELLSTLQKMKKK